MFAVRSMTIACAVSRAIAIVSLALAASSVASTGSLAAEERIAKDDAIAAIVGKTFDDGLGTVTYAKDGSYTYRETKTGKVLDGKYLVLDGGFICVTFPSSDFLCRLLARDGPHLVLKTPLYGDSHKLTLTPKD